MNSSSGITGSQERLERKGEDGESVRVLLVGPEGLALRSTVETLTGKGADGIEGAESILEAVLMAGGEGEAAVIFAGISQEIEQIEPAVRSMRKVYPGSRIVLLCEPGDEVLCRRAKGWGATDYVILPADAGSLRKMLAGSRKPEAGPPHGQKAEDFAVRRNGGAPLAVSEGSKEVSERKGNGRNAVTPAGALRNVVGVSDGREAAEQLGAALKQARGVGMQEGPLPALPLMVQTVLFNDLLARRADFADRVVATLQAYMKWGGALKFVPAAAAEEEAGAAGAAAVNPQLLKAPVDFPQQPTFGTLMLELAPGVASSATTSAALSQAANYMASLLMVARQYEQLRSLAITDELSGAFNRRYFMNFMSRLLERAREARFRVTLLLFDIDDFKRYNDTFGHGSGDAIIRELIKLLRACTRPNDLVARIGGDEFAVVYWDSEAPRQPNSEHPRDAIAATERFRKAVQTHEWSAACNIKGDLSISGGLATFPWDADSLEALMGRADEALLRAKAAGKNVIFLHGEACGETAIGGEEGGKGEGT